MLTTHGRVIGSLQNLQGSLIWWPSAATRIWPPRSTLTSEVKMKVLNCIEFDKNHQTFQSLINHAHFSKVIFLPPRHIQQIDCYKIFNFAPMNDCRSCLCLFHKIFYSIVKMTFNIRGHWISKKNVKSLTFEIQFYTCSHSIWNCNFGGF